MTARRILVPYGTRPEIIKLAPVVAALVAGGHDITVVDTGQHPDADMNSGIAAEMGLRPDLRFSLPSDGPERTGRLHADAQRAIARAVPDVVLALGDTATVPAYALAARAGGVAFAHLEAGLRSFNQRSIEETNRKVAAAAAQVHFAPTERAGAFLATEGIPAERVFIVGNPVIDALVARGHRRVDTARRHGVLITAHRASNVDDPDRLARLVDVAVGAASRIGPVCFPVHPRTAARLAATGLGGRLADGGVVTCAPLGYDALLARLAASQVVVTDSGGLQEEAAFFGVPVVVLRSSTPRWEGVEAGSAVLAGLADDNAAGRVLAAAEAFCGPGEQQRVATLACPYGDGRTGPRVAGLLGDEAMDALLRLDEPDFSDGRRPW